MDDTLLTVQEVAQILRVDYMTVRNWMRLGGLEYIRLPGNGERNSYRIRRSVVNRILTTPYQPARGEA